MPISSTGTQEMEESKLPSLFVVSGYRVFFWSNEEGEPIHVHVCKGRPSPNATKLWLTKTGGCIVASNGSGIPPRELRELTEFVSAQFFMICAKWKEFFKEGHYIGTFVYSEEQITRCEKMIMEEAYELIGSIG